MNSLGSILGRWHQWRKAYSHERSFARAKICVGHCGDDFEELELHAIEEAIEAMPIEMQRALQHVARAECMGVEVVFSGQLPEDSGQLESLCSRAVEELEKRLLRIGLL